MTEPSLPPLIRRMLLPEFYPHPVTEPIRLVQTHISYVFLTGTYAYKVKKPMNFGFLDFTTLEQRQFFCEEELRLNQRGAAELYLEVLPIVRAGEDYRFGGEGDIADFALKMRQFPQETLLTALYDRGEVTEQLVKSLAEAIAHFHTHSLTTNDYIRSFGTVERVREAFDENYDQTRGFIGGPQTQMQFDETQAHTDQFFVQRRSLFERRMASGHIRECHGDLHLGNISYWQDQFWLFDCIEFNEPFRFVDVMYDIGYLVMDFQVRNRPDLSTVFLNTYLECTGDWAGAEVLPIYVNRQAYVRAKVTSFVLGDPGVSAADKQQASETAATYYRLAWDCIQPRQGKLFLMSGLSGSGKSTVARLLAQTIGAIHIRSDAVRKHLTGVPLHDSGAVADEAYSGIYTPEMTDKTYARLVELGVSLAQAGWPVILDATFDREAKRAVAIAKAEAANIPLQLVACTAPIDTIKAWVAQRTGDIADATVSYLEVQQAAFEPLTERELHHTVTIHTDRDIEQQLASLAWLEAEPL